MKLNENIKLLKSNEVDKAFTLMYRVFKNNIKTNSFGHAKFKYNVIYNNRYRISCKKGINKLFGYYIDKLLVGVVCLSKNYDHVSFLFVRDDYQRKGIGSSLFNHITSYVKENCENKSIIINSYNESVDFYLKLNCEIIGEKEEKDGIIITPLIYKMEEL